MTALGPRQLALAECVFSAVLGDVEAHGLPAFAHTDRRAFVHALSTSPGPSFHLGFRLMLEAFVLLPLAYPGFGRRFDRLPPERRLDFVERLDTSPAFAPRKLLETMKLMASLAYFDDPSVRAHFDARRP